VSLIFLIQPVVVLLAFLAFIQWLPDIKPHKEDLLPLAIILLAGIALLALKTPKSITFGEYYYVEGAVNLAQYFSGALIQGLPGRPIGPGIFASLPILLGVNPLKAMGVSALILHLITPLAIYIAAKKRTGREQAMIVALLFTLLPVWVKIQKTMLSEIFSAFVLSVFLASFFGYLKDGDGKLMTASLVLLFYMRPENFPITLPFVFFICSRELKKDPKSLIARVLILSSILISFHLMLSANNQYGWIPSEKAIHEFPMKLRSNIAYFLNPTFFNPLVSVLAVASAMKRNQASLILLASFVLSILVFSVFELGFFSRDTGNALRYSITPAILVTVTSANSIKRKWVGYCTLLVSILVLAATPTKTRGTGEGKIIEFFTDGRIDIPETNVVFSPPGFLQLLFPEKRVYSLNSEKLFHGKGTLIRHSSESIDDYPGTALRNCNSTPVESYKLGDAFIRKYSIDCP